MVLTLQALIKGFEGRIRARTSCQPVVSAPNLRALRPIKTNKGLRVWGSYDFIIDVLQLACAPGGGCGSLVLSAEIKHQRDNTPRRRCRHLANAAHSRVIRKTWVSVHVKRAAATENTPSRRQ